VPSAAAALTARAAAEAAAPSAAAEAAARRHLERFHQQQVPAHFEGHQQQLAPLTMISRRGRFELLGFGCGPAALMLFVGWAHNLWNQKCPKKQT